MTNANQLTNKLMNSWADDQKGPVALHLKQKLTPVEGKGGVIFPPTYADIGYNIDTLSDGTKIATIDSVGSQANRMEPIFKDEPYSKLVPQIEIQWPAKDAQGKAYVEKLSILDLAHRSADAIVYSCPTLAPLITNAFRQLRERDDAGALCAVAPTSLVFGVWDSRGESAEKRPRLVRSIIRAWDVEPLFSAAQFNSVWKLLDEDQQQELKTEAKNKKVKLSEKGFADAPATFRRVSQNAAKQMPEFRTGIPNPDRRVLGGVIARGGIERNVTVNLVALRSINGADDKNTEVIRHYLLSLALVAASQEIELFLREGCLLRFADENDTWVEVPRRGKERPVDLISKEAQKTLQGYAKEAAKSLKDKWPNQLVHKFDLKAAKKLLAKKGPEEEEGS